jgi:hypothetical protein
MDARQFFSTMVDLSGSLPESHLWVARGMIEMMMIPKQVNVPYEQLLFGVMPLEGGAGDGGAGAGGQDSFEPAQVPAADAPVGQGNCARVPGSRKTALKGARAT